MSPGGEYLLRLLGRWQGAAMCSRQALSSWQSHHLTAVKLSHICHRHLMALLEMGETREVKEESSVTQRQQGEKS